MEIRKIREDDLPTLAALNAETFTDTAKGQALLTFKDAWDKRVGDACLVAEENQEIIGAIVVEKKITFIKGSSGIVSFFVKKEMQGKGVGTKLMETALAALKKNGYRNVSLSVALGNEDAISIYEREGFKPFRMLYLKEL